MKQHGALFTTENRLAIRDNRKTMTRRIPASFKEINEKPDEWEFYQFEEPNEHKGYVGFVNKADDIRVVKIPWAVGDELYIKEPHYLYGQWDSTLCNNRNGDIYEKWFFISFKDMGVKYTDNPPEDILQGHSGIGWFLRSPLFMFKEHARDWLRVTAVRCERLQSISEEDCFKEGIYQRGALNYFAPGVPGCPNTARDAYQRLWDSINRKKHPWERNEWDVAYTFERIIRSAKPVQGRC